MSGFGSAAMALAMIAAFLLVAGGATWHSGGKPGHAAF